MSLHNCRCVNNSVVKAAVWDHHLSRMLKLLRALGEIISNTHDVIIHTRSASLDATHCALDAGEQSHFHSVERHNSA